MSWKNVESIQKTLWKNKKALVVLAVAILLLVIVSQAASPATKPLGIVVPGWEIYNQIGALNTNYGIKSSAREFTSPRDISAPYWKVDADEPNYNTATIMIQTSDIRHVDFMGKPIPSSTPASVPIQVVRGNNTYILDYHVYMFDVTIRTVADIEATTDSGWYPSTYWNHETSWASRGDAFGWNPVAGSNKVGREFQGGPYVKFVISPWTGASDKPVPEGYVLQNAWAGVMNSYIFTKQQGQVVNQWGKTPEASSEAEKWVKGGLDNGAQVPMFKDDGKYGTAAPKVNWDLSLSPDARIESTVVLYLPVELLAGAKLTRDFFGTVTELSPCDVYVKYIIRVDVLQAHNFVLQSAYEPPELDIPRDFFSWAQSYWENPTNQALWGLILIATAGIIVFWIYWKYRKPGGGTHR